MQTSPLKHLLLAAESGDAAVQFNLGILYDSRLDDNGYAIEGNRAEAIKWLLAAAEQGLPRAQSQLATMYAGAPDAPELYIEA
jgi:TPR repeat protein